MRSKHPGSPRAHPRNRSTRDPSTQDRPAGQRPHPISEDRSPRHGHGASRRAPAPLAPAKGVFADLLPQLQRAIAGAGYLDPTPIQAQSIPHLLEGRDLLGTAQTGSGKTAAFTLPMLQHLLRHKAARGRRKPRALVVAPTRELAAQIDDCVGTYGRYMDVRHTSIYGGVGQRPQVEALKRGLDVVVATPGRLLDLMQQGFVHLDQVEIFVLDEVDRMLDMGFIHDIKKIIAALPSKRQSLFFSATMAPEVTALAKTLVTNPVQVSITPEQPAVERIVQKILFVEKKNKVPLLTSLLRDPAVDKVLVFTRLKHTANRVAEKLVAAGIPAAAIHGNKSQQARTRALTGFKAGRVRALVATDIAARGIDVDGITHVINYDLPNEPETYVHRIGRTARAGAEGDAVSFCSAEERPYLRDIERLIKTSITIDTEHAYHSEVAAKAGASNAGPSRRRSAWPKPPRVDTARRRRRGPRSNTGRRS